MSNLMQDLWPTATTPEKVKEIIEIKRRNMREDRKQLEYAQKRIDYALEDINRLKQLACVNGWDI